MVSSFRMNILNLFSNCLYKVKQKWKRSYSFRAYPGFTRGVPLVYFDDQCNNTVVFNYLICSNVIDQTMQQLELEWCRTKCLCWVCVAWGSCCCWALCLDSYTLPYMVMPRFLSRGFSSNSFSIFVWRSTTNLSDHPPLVKSSCLSSCEQVGLSFGSSRKHHCTDCVC